MRKISLEEFKTKIESLSWDDFMMIYENRSLYEEERINLIITEHGRRCSEFNRYMSF
jgi:hypothetical protein